jgi:hypothetical protein
LHALVLSSFPKRTQQLCCMCPATCPSLPLSKEKLDQTQLHVPSLGAREKGEGEGEGRLNNWNQGKRGSLGPAGNNQQRKKSRKPILEGRIIAPRLAQKLSKKHEVRPISFSWLAFTPRFQTKGKGKKTKKWKGWCSCTLTQGILTKWTDLCRTKDEWTHAQTLTLETWTILNAWT